MYTVLVIADDLTGATDTGHQFAVDGLRTVVTSRSNGVEPESMSGSEFSALVVDTDSRTVAASAAYDTVADVVENVPAETVYKKVDSTLRGNVAAEIEAMLDRRQPDLAVVAPAFPAAGRVTAGGYHFVDGQPITSAADYQERESPPSTSHVPTLLTESSYPVEPISIDTVAEGVDATATALESAKSSSTTLAVCDAATGDHLASIAEVADRIGTSVFVGSAGLAKHLRPPGATAPQNRVLGVAGSTNERTAEQLSALPEEWVVDLDTESALDDPKAAGREVAERTIKRLRARGTAIIASVRSPDDAERTLQHGHEKYDFDEVAVRSHVETALTTAVDECWREASPDGLFLTGGTVAKCVLGVLSVDTVELTGREVEDGIPIATFGERISLVTKAGGFGAPKTIENCLTALRRS